MRDGDETLRVEHAGAQERDRDHHFEPRSSRTRRVRHRRRQGSIGVAAGTLTTSAGRASPPCRGLRTRPRPAAAIASGLLAAIEFGEQFICSADEVVVSGQIVDGLRHSSYQFGHEFRPIRIGKCLELFESFLAAWVMDSDSHLRLWTSIRLRGARHLSCATHTLRDRMGPAPGRPRKASREVHASR